MLTTFRFVALIIACSLAAINDKGKGSASAPLKIPPLGVNSQACYIARPLSALVSGKHSAKSPLMRLFRLIAPEHFAGTSGALLFTGVKTLRLDHMSG